MTSLFFAYELKVAVLIAVFYVFWRLLVANETWHRLNRLVLLSTAIASFVLPLCVFTIHQTVELDAVPMEMLLLPTPSETAEMQKAATVTTTVAKETSFDWHLLIVIIYITGVLVVLSRMTLSLWRLHRMIVESEIHPLADGLQIAVCDKAKAPFSWWKTVFLNHQDFEEGETALLTHELEHIRLHHSADVVLVELLTSLQWFNPAMWMLRSDLRTIHEYQADQQVLSHGFNDIQYLNLLIRNAAVQGGYSLANGINNSTLKKRVTMIMKPRSNRWATCLKLLALVPIVGICLALNAETVTDVVYKTDEPQKQVPVKKGKKNATIKTDPKQAVQVVEMPKRTDKDKMVAADDSPSPTPYALGLPLATKGTQEERGRGVGSNMPDVYTTVEEKPQFPGGASAMMKYLISNFPNLVDAAEAGFQGRVTVGFIVEKDGSISNARVTQPTHTALDEEALRLVSSMPNWTPGKQNGEAVRVDYSLPLTFDLKGKETTEDVGTVTPHIEGVAMPRVDDGHFTLDEVAEQLTGVDENGKIIVNGKEVKRFMIDGSDELSKAIMTILLNDSEHFDYEIDGEPVSAKDMQEKKSPLNPIKRIEYVQKDGEHPKDRLVIITKEAE